MRAELAAALFFWKSPTTSGGSDLEFVPKFVPEIWKHRIYHVYSTLNSEFESCHPDWCMIAANPRFFSKIKGLRLFSYFKINLFFMWIKQDFISFLSRICPGSVRRKGHFGVFLQPPSWRVPLYPSWNAGKRISSHGQSPSRPSAVCPLPVLRGKTSVRQNSAGACEGENAGCRVGLPYAPGTS